jgi:outer membrane protein OmpA-like peptidoglycan-associated protein
LSERRAGTVGTYLRTKGVNDQRIATVGFGKTHPVASNDTPDGRQQNRRVELTLTPLTG